MGGLRDEVGQVVVEQGDDVRDVAVDVVVVLDQGNGVRDVADRVARAIASVDVVVVLEQGDDGDLASVQGVGQQPPTAPGG